MDTLPRRSHMAVKSGFLNIWRASIKSVIWYLKSHKGGTVNDIFSWGRQWGKHNHSAKKTMHVTLKQKEYKPPRPQSVSEKGPSAIFWQVLHVWLLLTQQKVAHGYYWGGNLHWFMFLFVVLGAVQKSHLFSVCTFKLWWLEKKTFQIKKIDTKLGNIQWFKRKQSPFILKKWGIFGGTQNVARYTKQVICTNNMPWFPLTVNL